MNILITGCSSGIGYQTVLALAQMGTHHITAIARNTLGLAQLKQEFQALGTKSSIDTITFDLSQAHYDDLISKLNYSNDKPLDILINNAGYLVNASFMETSIEQWHKVFEVNLFAGIKLIKALYPKFNRSKGAHIVNVGSMGGVQGSAKYEGLAAYSASKGAVNILTESLSVEFAKENIHVNAINPGAVQTKMLEEAFPTFKASISSEQMGRYIANFALYNKGIMNGRLIQASLDS